MTEREHNGMMSKKNENKKNPDLEKAQDQFILEWGRMSSSWGINRTMAQILALLFTSREALTVDEIMDHLRISRGNASMSLRDLMDWGIVRRFRLPGERRDTYSCESDPYLMFAKVSRERKRREVDPTVSAIRECISRLPEAPEDEDVEAFRTRLQGLLDIFSALDAVYQQVLSSDKAFIEAMQIYKKGMESQKS